MAAAACVQLATSPVYVAVVIAVCALLVEIHRSDRALSQAFPVLLLLLVQPHAHAEDRLPPENLSTLRRDFERPDAERQLASDQALLAVKEAYRWELQVPRLVGGYEGLQAR